MRMTSDDIQLACSLLKSLPEGTYFSFNCKGTVLIQGTSTSQGDMLAIRKALPPSIWRRSWAAQFGWWEYGAKIGNLNVEIYAVRESPPTCTAIVEKRIVTEQKPTAWETVEVEQDVIVGWDCQNHEQVEENKA